VVIGAQRFSRRMHMTDEQKKQLQKDMKKYGQEQDHRAVLLFKQLADEVNEVTGQVMVDPSTRQKVGKSDLDEVILEQIGNFTMNWVKGRKTRASRPKGSTSGTTPASRASSKRRTASSTT